MGVEDNDVKFMDNIEKFERRAGKENRVPWITPIDNSQFKITNEFNHASMIMTKDRLTIFNQAGSQLAEINLFDGSVKLEGTPDEAATQFWNAVKLLHKTFLGR